MTHGTSSGLSRRGVVMGGLAASALGAINLGVFGLPAARAAEVASPLAVDPATVPHKYFAFDTGLWNGHLMKNCQVQMGQFVKDAEHNPLFREGIFETPRLPWEPRYDNGYPNVFWDTEHNKYRCYYTLFVRDPASLNTSPKDRSKSDYVIANRQTGLAYAESPDGINWNKPQLGLVNFDGSTANNLLFTDIQGTSVLYDPEDADPNRRYKLLTLKEKGGTSLSVAFSADGIHFTPLQAMTAEVGRFGIRVTLAAPGAIETAWAGGSIRFSSPVCRLRWPSDRSLVRQPCLGRLRKLPEGLSRRMWQPRFSPTLRR